MTLAQPFRDRLKCVRAPRDQEEMHAPFGELRRERRAKTLRSPRDHSPSAVTRSKVTHMNSLLVRARVSGTLRSASRFTL